MKINWIDIISNESTCFTFILIFQLSFSLSAIFDYEVFLPENTSPMPLSKKKKNNNNKKSINSEDMHNLTTHRDLLTFYHILNKYFRFYGYMNISMMIFDHA